MEESSKMTSDGVYRLVVVEVVQVLDDRPSLLESLLF